MNPANDMSGKTIRSQVKLPAAVAVGVVMQGIRIRFGRSVVTILGVTLGIAFLMSILTGMVVKQGVGEEDRLRTETGRMGSFLTAEMGPSMDRVVGVIQTGELNELERRLMARLEGEGLRQLNWTQTAAGAAKPRFAKITLRETSLAGVGAEASAVLLVGAGAMPAIAPDDLFAGARQRILAATRRANVPQMADGQVRVVTLERELRPEEIEKIAAEERKNRFRSIWIIIISLVVTVIGISNAMLMSVTERFREIGTMKCLGALSSFIRRLFLIESSLMGAVGGALGGLLGAVFAVIIYAITYGPGLTLAALDLLTLGGYYLAALVAGVVLSIVAAIYPASVAASMVPATALRTNI